MGQQQLLLIVLSAIIVGVAIVVGINMFGKGAYQSNREAVIQDAVNVAAKAQEWYRKPDVLGGGNRTFDGVSLSALGVPVKTFNDSLAISGSGQSATVTAVGKEDGDGDGTPITITLQVFPDSVGVPSITNQ